MEKALSLLQESAFNGITKMLILACERGTTHKPKLYYTLRHFLYNYFNIVR
jgi:hypothetical protein